MINLGLAIKYYSNKNQGQNKTGKMSMIAKAE